MIVGIFIGVILGIVIISLLRTGADSDDLIKYRDAIKLAVQARLVGAIYSKKLHTMAEEWLKGITISEEIICPVCDKIFQKCTCGLCMEKKNV